MEKDAQFETNQNVSIESDYNKLRPLDNQSLKRLTQVIQTAEEQGDPEPRVSLHDLRRAAMCHQLIIQPDMFTPKAREVIVTLLRDYYNRYEPGDDQ